MYKAKISFAANGTTYRQGDDVPEDLRYNDERLQRGLIYETKTVKPETKDEPVSQRKQRKPRKRKPADATE